MLELLVSHYREPEHVVDRLLQCLAAQRGVDFSEVVVTVCNDGHDVPLSIGSGDLPYRLRYFEADRGGVSHTRNALLDSATGDHVMFVDCDDLPYTMFSLRRLLELCGGYDMVTTSYMQEHEDGSPSQHDGVIQMMQGKIFDLGFLRRNGISFNEDFVISGDPYFLWQAMFLGSNRSVREPLWVWTYNRGSVCRDSDDHFLRVTWRRVESDGALVDLFDKRGMRDKADFFVRRMVIHPYVIAHLPGWAALEGGFDHALSMRRLSWWLRKYYARYASLPERDRRRHYESTSRFYHIEPEGGFEGIGPWARALLSGGA